MNESQTKQRLLDIKEYSAKIRNSLKKLEASQQPGEQSGKGSKTEVLEAVKSEIQELIKKGYTTKQIANAISSDVFGILPKTITQLVGAKHVSKKTRARHPPAPPASAPNEPQQKVPEKQRKPVTEISDVE